MGADDRSYGSVHLMGMVFIESALASSPAAVWAVVGTMGGVNAELGPWLHMTTPRGLAAFRIEDAPLGRIAFASWVCVAKIPFDRHSLCLARVEPEKGFREESHSWLQSRWIHERTLTPSGVDECIVQDRVEFEPRVRLLDPIVERAVLAVFRHRHGILRKRFGAARVSRPHLSTS